MKTIVFELESAANSFKRIYKQVLEKNQINEQDQDANELNLIYEDSIKTICSNIMDCLIGRSFNITNLDSSTMGSLDTIAEKIGLWFFRTYNVNIDFEEALRVVSNIETSIIDDICRNIPFIDDQNVIVKEYKFIPNNSMAIFLST
jgi:hypothetical protein